MPPAAVGHTSFIRIINTGSKASTITVADIDDVTGTVSPDPASKGATDGAGNH